MTYRIIAILAFVIVNHVFCGFSYSQQRGIKKTISAQESNQERYRALIIGNNEYQNWPKLRTAVHDAEKLAVILKSKYGYGQKDILLLRNATRIEMLDGIDWLKHGSVQYDHVLIYYGGHGEYDDNEDGWWVPVDGGLNKKHNHISNSDLLNKLRSVNAQHKLLISDSCFSGNLFTRGIQKKKQSNWSKLGWIREKSLLKSVWGLSSGGDEPVSDGGPKFEGHSIFAYHLLAHLEANQRPFLAASELGSRLVNLVANDTMEVTGATQTPIIRSILNQGDQGGEFFFIREDLSKISAVVLYHLSGSESESTLKEAKKEIHKTIKRAAGSSFRLKLLPKPLEFMDQGQLPHLISSNGVNHALVINLDGSLQKQLTSMWVGLAKIKLSLQHLHLENGEIHELNTLEFPESRMPLRKWEESNEFSTSAFTKAGRKLSKHLSNKGLDDFLWSMVVGKNEE